jgi:hypothetical protein
MTGHQINSLVGDLVAMAQAMERLPQVEGRVRDLEATLMAAMNENASVHGDLEQSRSYAASLEQKVHDAEVARDDAELRFLELDEQAGKAVHSLADIMDIANELRTKLDTVGVKQPEPIISEVKPIAADPTSAPFPSVTTPTALAPIDHPQGQSEADPIHGASQEPQEHPANTISVEPSATQSPTPTPPQPYAGKRYIYVPDFISRQDWLDGGGNEADYDF